jgi:protein-disulfide isomerase
MVEYVDLQCPYCQQFETQVLPDLVAKYVRAGTLKIELRPWAFIGPDSTRGQAAVLAAAQQNKAFNYAELLYDNQGTENTGWLDDNMVTAAATSIPGLRVAELLTARNSAAVKSAAQNVAKLAAADSVNSTPTIFVGKTGTHGMQLTLKSPTDEATVVAAVNAAKG